MKCDVRAWHSLPGAAALQHVDSSEAGLGAAAAAERLRQAGPNQQREEAQTGALSLFLGQFKSIIIWILIAAGIISGVLDVGAIALVLLEVVKLVKLARHRKKEASMTPPS
ncbi:cation-transporting P-type ATPase [Massilia scottii]|uniref:cation-transporting P-type ATPase n=1 Tax=Massilia scottii TaxID=3057166 RepID=UPI0027965CBC|nr:cation-transporting P-type ATPase [Massilia sp. CCM 9029]MDQ1831639.1 cation-transporting P-type ATPase [Massilia sp. CCM 9029]